jgi:hypothetical protein
MSRDVDRVIDQMIVVALKAGTMEVEHLCEGIGYTLNEPMIDVQERVEILVAEGHIRHRPDIRAVELWEPIEPAEQGRADARLSGRN